MAPMTVGDLPVGTHVRLVEERSHFDGHVGVVLARVGNGSDLLVQLDGEVGPLRFGRGSLVPAAPPGPSR